MHLSSAVFISVEEFLQNEYSVFHERSNVSDNPSWHDQDLKANTSTAVTAGSLSDVSRA